MAPFSVAQHVVEQYLGVLSGQNDGYAPYSHSRCPECVDERVDRPDQSYGGVEQAILKATKLQKMMSWMCGNDVRYQMMVDLARVFVDRIDAVSEDAQGEKPDEHDAADFRYRLGREECAKALNTPSSA